MKHLKRNTITNERLHELLDYNPDTGVFTWKISRSGVKAGTVAGAKNCGYIRIRVDGIKHYAHRLAWQYVHGYDTEWEIDHINRIRDDNRIVNLREASKSCNAKNTCIRRNNNSGVNGIYWNKKFNKWLAQIGINGKRKHLGLYTSLLDAALARLLFEIQHPDIFSCDASRKTQEAVERLIAEGDGK